jgi:hypothetical protein
MPEKTALEQQLDAFTMARVPTGAPIAGSGVPGSLLTQPPHVPQDDTTQPLTPATVPAPGEPAGPGRR